MTPISRRRSARAAVLLAAFLSASCAHKGAEPSKHVVLLGLDGGTWDLLDPYIARGLLPNLARLRERGTGAPLKSIQPSSSPVIWTTIATGKMPDKHGITFFVRFPDGETGAPRPVTSSMRRGKALWNMLSPEHDVAIVGWFVTWPVEAVNGRMISDRAHWGAMDKDGVFPPSYLADFQPPTLDDGVRALPQFATFDLDRKKVDPNATDPEGRLNYLVYDRLVKAYSRDLFYLRAAERVLEDKPLPQLFALYLRGTDDVQHGFWKFMQPELFEGVTPEQAEHFGKVIERYWQWTDAAVGKVLSYYEGKDPLVIVVSDHGAGPAVGSFKVFTKEYLHLSGSHRDTGILIAEGPGIRRGAKLEDASVRDVTPTILDYMGEPVADDMDGRVLAELFEGPLAERKPAHVPTYDDASDGPAGPVSSEYDEKALEHLRSLGYID